MLLLSFKSQPTLHLSVIRQLPDKKEMNQPLQDKIPKNRIFLLFIVIILL